jgi:hypothetical protein
MASKNEWLKEGIGFVDITLAKPADISGTATTTIRMREPTVGDQEAASIMTGSDASREIQLLANLCELDPSDIRKMSLANYNRLQKAYVVFLG